MKKYKLYLYLILTIIISSCSNDEGIDNTPELGLLKKIEGSANGYVTDITELSYDENHRLSSLKQFQGNYATLSYDIEYGSDKVRSITSTYHWHPQHADTTIVEVYNVTYQDHEIMLTPVSSGYQRIFQITDGYVDSYKFFWGPKNEFLNESVFTRDANNNIENISYYQTNEVDTDFLVWNYTYSDFDTNANLNSAYNPVFYYSHSLYDPLIGAVLNLNISKDTPLKSSYSDSNGTYKEENITAKRLEYEYGFLKNISYEYVNNPSDDYQLEFSYY